MAQLNQESDVDCLKYKLTTEPRELGAYPPPPPELLEYFNESDDSTSDFLTATEQ